ncbi:MAG: Grx4 family monothiol glutaredoxin [Deltaproteobacteria bacterium]|nr:Grx4 family monothiol glutaredoxin [Deltaproteobacteria bacterium]
MSPETKENIEQMIASHKIVVFMKGSVDFPQCGFSSATVECFLRLGAQFETVNVLADESVRAGIKAYSNWPTIPQVYIDGQFMGGCDIVREMFANGQLKEKVRAVGAVAA